MSATGEPPRREESPTRGTENPSPGSDDPTRSDVQRYLLFTLSLPERALRTTVGLVSGAAQEAATLLLPQAFRDSKTYQALIQQNLDYLRTSVGGVRPAGGGPGTDQVQDFVARKAVGNFVDAVGLLTIQVSPFVVLAVVSDVAYGSNAFLKELAQELKRQRVIAEDSTIDRVDDLLAALANVSGRTADAVNTPPLSLEGLKETVAETRDAVRGVDPTQWIPQAELTRLWNEMHEIAEREGVSLWTVSTSIAMQVFCKVGDVGRGLVVGMRVAGGLLQHVVFDHYASALRTVKDRGVFPILAETAAPYIDAVWLNFAFDRPTVTEEVVTGRCFGRAWRCLRGLFRRPNPTAQQNQQS